MSFRILIGISLGGALGFAYYKIVGCPSGTCPITSNPFVSTIWGAVIGLLISMDKPKADKKIDETNNN